MSTSLTERRSGASLGLGLFGESDDQLVCRNASKQHGIDTTDGRRHTPQPHPCERHGCHDPRQHLHSRSPHERDHAAEAEIFKLSMHGPVQSNRLARNRSVIFVKSGLFSTNRVSEIYAAADLYLLVKRADA